ncbi:hypothetical protein POSPLADRAFT_1145708 [Postia placenta MAD-698-R-SB12]|uniref:Yeast cell wall synthesis Kre9/Knh1-like N-terminal domain-containing protein n=1 Tax=Postia placenta MAD-698-R-SB12 TaxID=670580 RepID=A0A1X6MYF0_9APHY|nr:hypothetical protein POSPLADRAFT_1145708 [Postia placenta MAD-698-R-SB12]OSX61272.1 hypothetical protein POSPLADRAFT_1145708 [Postia placenta MAD-698-R-SB12]
MVCSAFMLAAATLVTPLVSASGMTVNLTTPTVWTRGTNVNETWSSVVGPYNSGLFSLLLVNTNDTGVTLYTLATNVPAYYDIIHFTVPTDVPVSSNYTLQAVNLTNYDRPLPFPQGNYLPKMSEWMKIKAEYKRSLGLTKHCLHLPSWPSFEASPSVCGLRLQTPTGVYPGAVVDETWVSEPSDPATFSLWIVNPDVHIGLALVASVNTSEGHVYFTVPDLPPS